MIDEGISAIVESWSYYDKWLYFVTSPDRIFLGTGTADDMFSLVGHIWCWPSFSEGQDLGIGVENHLLYILDFAVNS